MDDREFDDDEFWESIIMHQAYIQNMKKSQKSKLEDDMIKEKQNDTSVIALILRQNADFFTADEYELLEDEEAQYELLWDLILAKGELVCEIQWDSGVMSGKSWMKKINTYYFAYDEVEPLYGPFDSLDAALESCNTCRYISDAVTSIYIHTPIETVDWTIVADDGHTLMINSEEYMIQNQSLVKVSQNKEERPAYASDLSEEVAQKLEVLIKKFNNDPKYRRYIINKGNSMILENNDKSSDQAAEERLVEMAIHSRY